MEGTAPGSSPFRSSGSAKAEAVAGPAAGNGSAGEKKPEIWIPPSLRRARAAAELAAREESQRNQPSERQVSVQLCVVDAFWRCLSPAQPDVALAGVHALAAVVNQ